MFASQMKEAADNVVVIKDISAPTMEHFLSFLYCGYFQDDSWVNYLPSLTHVGHKVRSVNKTALYEANSVDNGFV